MKVIVEVKREGKWYVATDLVTQITDQGRTRQEALDNLIEGLRERHELLPEL